MILYSFLFLISVGLLALLLPQNKYATLVALAQALFLLWLGGSFYHSWQVGDFSAFTYPWVKFKNLKITLDLSSSAYNYSFILPIFLLSVLTAFLNVFYRFENEKLRFNTLILLNLAAFILLVCSQNTLQLLVSSSLVGILGFYLINDFEAKQQYAYYNLLADMGLFMVFAIVYGRIGKVELSALVQYKRLGSYSDVLALMLLFSVFVKSGLFLFQNQILDWRHLNFNRLMLVSFCLTPMSAIIILVKVNPLLAASSFSVPILSAIAGASLIWGFLGALLMDNIREKALYMNMMMYGFYFGMLSQNPGVVSANFPLLPVAGYFINLTLAIPNTASSNEIYVSDMGGFFKQTKISFVVTLLLVAAFIQTVLLAQGSQNAVWIWSYLSLVLIALAHTLHGIYFGNNHSDERVWAFLKNPPLFNMLLMAGISVVLMYYNHVCLPKMGWAFAAFLLLMLSGALRWLQKAYTWDALQDADGFNWFYETVLIGPIKIIGRVLWLTVDFLLIERTVLTSLSHSTGWMIAAARKINAGTWWSYLLLSGIGIGFLLYFGGVGR